MNKQCRLISGNKLSRSVQLFALGVALTVSSSSALAALERIGDFALLDDQGEFHQLSRYQHRRAVVLMAYDASCANMDVRVRTYRELHSKFAEQDVEFLLLDSLDKERENFAAQSTGLPILRDDGQLISERLQMHNAGAVRILNPGRLSLFYKGDLGAELEQTLSALLTQPPTDTVNAIDPTDCAIAFPVRDRHASAVPDYATEIAPIIIENCSECHRLGSVGPFALDRYISVMGWSPMIREVLLNKRMPPAQVDPETGHSTNARYMATEDLQTMVHWIDAGAPRGDSDLDPLEQVGAMDTQQWLLGEPDYIVNAPPVQIPATGILDYVYTDVVLPFDEDRWVRAVQYQAGSPAVLHHLMTYVTAPDEDFWGAERNSTAATRRFVEGYAPGRPTVTEYPEGTGLFIPKGHKLSLQFHYVGNGQAFVDNTRLGLYFVDPATVEDGAVQERLTQSVSADFVLPANVSDYEMQASYLFTEAVELTGVRARMNYRGKNMKFSVERADGSLQDIFSVPAYNYGWQPHYILQEPVRIPAGTRVHVTGAFDNSVSNPANPDPSKELSSGVESGQEMFTGYFTFHRVAD